MVELTGLWMALATFLGIWWGHVGVRWLEAHVTSIWPSVIVLALAGLVLNISSLFAPTLALSGVASIIGMTLFWDAFEMYRQQKRILKGHAPANPNNPRHAAVLAAGKGTTQDLLDREPQGFPVGQPSAAFAGTRAVTPRGKQRGTAYEEVEA